jgi:hypothetical protein
MERISLAQLNNALTALEESSPKSLSREDSSTLLALVESLTRRYPSQDQEGSIEEYFLDYERLALKCSLPRLTSALLELRTKAGRAFFPRPDEVAEQIEANMDMERVERDRERQARQRTQEIAEFWERAPEWMQMAGCSEEEMLERFPSYRGTKP